MTTEITEGKHDSNDGMFKIKVLKTISEKEVNEWLRRNPKPADWIYGTYEYVYEEMPRSKFLSWWRRKFLGYKLN